MNEREPLRDVIPRPGEIWQGGGTTVRVVAIWPGFDDDSDVLAVRLTGRSGLLKRPGRRVFIPMRLFRNGCMKRLDATRDDPWAQAILERYGRV